jgi:hypothetical protein
VWRQAVQPRPAGHARPDGLLADPRTRTQGRHAQHRGNFFVDDHASTHEASINKGASAGLIGGTGTLTFQPGGTVTRGQMASFVARSLDLLVREVTPPLVEVGHDVPRKTVQR